MMGLRNIFIAICLTLLPTLASAQSSINKIVESLEDDKNVENVLYSEQRNLKTKKVVKSSRIIKFSSDKLAAKLISAFKKERENAISFKSVSQPSNTVYEMSFNDGEGNTSKYTLAQQEGNWILSVSVLNSARTAKRTTTRRTNTRRTNASSSRSKNTSYQIIETTTVSDPDLHIYLSSIDDNDRISSSDLLENDFENHGNEDILVAKETDNGCETYIIRGNSSKSSSKSSKTSKPSKAKSKSKSKSSKPSSFSKSSSSTTITNQGTVVYKSPNGEVTYIRYK